MTDHIPFRRVSILGVGLLGGSIGLALRRAGFAGSLVGFGHRQSSLDTAVAAGCIDTGTLDLAEAVDGADLVILCSPVALFEGMFRELGGIFGRAGFQPAANCGTKTHDRLETCPTTIITDVGSTKKQVVAWARKLLPKCVQFVGSHPIAGSDKRGSQFARADLFDGACCVLTPSPCRERSGVRGHGSEPPTPHPRPLSLKGEGSAVLAVESFWRALGMWTVRMTPSTHDRALARISHLPHATAAALMLLSDSASQDLAGGGFLDTTRIAGGDPVLWRDIFLTNGQQVVRAIKALNAKLERLATLIEKRDGAGLVRYLAQAQQRRADLMARRLKRRRVEG